MPPKKSKRGAPKGNQNAKKRGRAEQAPSEVRAACTPPLLRTRNRTLVLAHRKRPSSSRTGIAARRVQLWPAQSTSPRWKVKRKSRATCAPPSPLPLLLKDRPGVEPRALRTVCALACAPPVAPPPASLAMGRPLRRPYILLTCRSGRPCRPLLAARRREAHVEAHRCFRRQHAALGHWRDVDALPCAGHWVEHIID